jgi:4-amino-4-deoxy-L-arabinose transferase-like glycosyltransferase
MGLIDKKNLSLLFVLIFILHLAKIPNSFTWLDHRDIEAGRSLFSINELYQAFVRPFSDTHFYRPLVSISHSLNFSCFGLNAYAFHTFSVLLHALVCICLAICAKIIFRLTDRASLFSGFIMGIAPTSFLPAGQISYVSELLLALFYLLSLIFYQLYAQNQLKRYAALCFGVISLALLSKESALVFIPATLLILEFYSPLGLSLKKIVRLFLFLIIPSVLYLSLRFSILPQGWIIPNQSDSWGSWLALRLVNYGNHLTYLLNPWPPKLSDAVPNQALFSLPMLAYFFVLLFLVCMLVKLKDFPVRTALTLILLLVSPTLNILPLPRFFSSHYLYLPSLMFSILLTVLVTKQGWILKVPILLWILIATIGTAISGKRLQDDFTLFSPAVAKDSCYREGHFYLGGYFLSQGSPLEAERHYFSSLKPLPGFYSFYDPMAGSIGLALAEIDLKNYSDAEAILNAIEPNAKGFDLENLNKIRRLLPSPSTVP